MLCGLLECMSFFVSCVLLCIMITKKLMNDNVGTFDEDVQPALAPGLHVVEHAIQCQGELPVMLESLII